MEWYYVAAIIIAYIATMCGIMYAAKKGFISKDTLNSITGIASGLDTVAKTLNANGNGNEIFNIASMITSFVNSCVLAAENAWYNNTITKEERHEYCVDKLNELLTAYNIVIPEGEQGIIDTLISAACEQMGHEDKAGE